MQRFNKNLAAIALAVSILSGFPGQAVFAANPAAVNLGSAGNYAVLFQKPESQPPDRPLWRGIWELVRQPRLI